MFWFEYRHILKKDNSNYFPGFFQILMFSRFDIYWIQTDRQTDRRAKHYKMSDLEKFPSYSQPYSTFLFDLKQSYFSKLIYVIIEYLN